MIAALMLAVVLQTAPDPAEAEVAAVLEALDAASAAADGEAYFALFTPEARFVGTDATEHWTMAEFRAFAEPHFARGNGWSYPETERTITIAPIDCRCVAWFEEKLASASYGETRGSGVLRLTDEGWKIEQYVLSFPIPNETTRPVLRVIETFRHAEPAAAAQDAAAMADQLIAEETAALDALADGVRPPD